MPAPGRRLFRAPGWTAAPLRVTPASCAITPAIVSAPLAKPPPWRPWRKSGNTAWSRMRPTRASGRSPSKTVTDLDPDLAILQGGEDQHTVVLAFSSHAPALEEPVGEVADLSSLQRPESDHRNLSRRLLLQFPEASVQRPLQIGVHHPGIVADVILGLQTLEQSVRLDLGLNLKAQQEEQGRQQPTVRSHGLHCTRLGAATEGGQSRTRRNLKALAITERELRAMAAAASMGFSVMPQRG